MKNNSIIYEKLIRILKEKKSTNAYWKGKLSSSALATSVSIVAFKKNDIIKFQNEINCGLNWLKQNINTDGGYGDTPDSISNVSTTLLTYSAIYFCSDSNENDFILEKIKTYIYQNKIELNGKNTIKSVLNFYGKDLTFSLPIISMLIICGIISEEKSSVIPSLPFELAILPNRFYSLFNLQVVSYAIPALIAVGIYIFQIKKTNFLNQFIKKMTKASALRKLEKIMPQSGGFLEAIPLTAFVCICLITADIQSNVITNGIVFLQKQQQPDGSFPIDTDLSTWVTTLTVKAIGNKLDTVLSNSEISILREHLLSLQYKEKHPFNEAEQGGWGWTNFSGSVPDVDDTSGAILALIQIYNGTETEILAIKNACKWLINLQNKDGGFPTFCKGWGKLPFDSSCPDLTGHALLAITKSIEIFKNKMESKFLEKIDKSTKRAINYLEKTQNINGSWNPLWFGNQHTKNKQNPIYGTAKICTYLSDLDLSKINSKQNIQKIELLINNGIKFIINQQNTDGSWGGEFGIDGTIEETALSISALSKQDYKLQIETAFSWLEKEFMQNGLNATPIGLYFSALWYSEEMYPLIFYTEALRRNLDNNSTNKL